MGERRGESTTSRPGGPLVWIHGASVGETISLLPIAERLAADRISVLNFGRKIAEGSPQEVLRNPDVIAAYLGTEGKVN